LIPKHGSVLWRWVPCYQTEIAGNIVVQNTEAAILERLFAAPPGELTPEAARYLFTLDFSTADHERMEELARRAQAGSLTQDEYREVESYRRISQVLARMQARARRVLLTHPQAT
jgi:hypothetical protein